LSKPRPVKRKQDLATVIIVFPNPLVNPSEPEKESQENDEPRTKSKD
jgi:hypothetical protein